MTLIGISGKAQSGKDTAGEFLVNKYEFKRVASADALKRIARNIFGWDAVKDEKGRKFLQDLAMAVRGYDKDYWIRVTLQEINSQRTRNKVENFVITDVRFENEAKYLKEQGAILVRINRPDILLYDHVSETELDNYEGFNFVLENNSTIKDLEKDIDVIYKGLKNEAEAIR